MPIDFLDIIEYRFFLDNVDEFLDFYKNIPDPPDYVIYTPKLFYDWTEWAKNYKEPKDYYRPFGEMIGPSWMINEFEDLESFYKFYLDIIKG